ncbi:hypothetical protein AAF712_010151 [Marasmius tenuissimus]|uniref:RRM domain-containing protein n=1 Tax=Marasmius tenuissimus TaxID=585030 RepID=A0ABR2ZP35_9AGAR
MVIYSYFDAKASRKRNKGTNLHVRGLSRNVDTRLLEETFTRAGRVAKAEVVYDPHTRDSRGFGFVAMESPEEAEAAIAALSGTELLGKTITIEKARRGRARTPTPGKYYGPPKSSRHSYERPYDPRPYDSRYADEYPRRGRDRSRSEIVTMAERKGRDYDYDRTRDDEERGHCRRY